jgi:hypothetical protein
MTLEQAHTITNLAKHMLVRASEDFEPAEFIESVKLFNEIVKELTQANLDNDTVKYNNMGDKS